MKTTEFSVKKSKIPGLLEFDITFIEDPRGWFQEKYQKAKLVPLGLPEDFQAIQQNISFNKEAGVLRGIHAEPWDKYISVVSGEVFAVYVDLRKENFGAVAEIQIHPGKAVFVPKGVANSFQTLKPDTYYSYLVNDHWSEKNLPLYKFVNLADPDLNINWPIPIENSILSDRDKGHPFIKDVTPYENL